MKQTIGAINTMNKTESFGPLTIRTRTLRAAGITVANGSHQISSVSWCRLKTIAEHNQIVAETKATAEVKMVTASITRAVYASRNVILHRPRVTVETRRFHSLTRRENTFGPGSTSAQNCWPERLQENLLPNSAL